MSRGSDGAPSIVAVLRRWDQIKARLFTAAVAPSLGGCARGTVLRPPLRLFGEQNIHLGAEVFIGPGSWLQTLPPAPGSPAGVLRVGARTSMAGYCVVSAAAAIDIGSDVLFGQNVLVVDHNHAFSDPLVPIIHQGVEGARPVRIGDGSWLAQNVAVCPGVAIGERVVVGANSVVTHDLPSGCLAAGAPARVIRACASVRRPA